jgi:hypothetical protein
MSRWGITQLVFTEDQITALRRGERVEREYWKPLDFSNVDFNRIPALTIGKEGSDPDMFVRLVTSVQLPRGEGRKRKRWSFFYTFEAVA